MRREKALAKRSLRAPVRRAEGRGDEARLAALALAEARAGVLLQNRILAEALGCHLAAEDLDRIYPTDTETRMYITGDEPMIPPCDDF